MKVKTSELIGPVLDWAVAKVKGNKYGSVTFDPKTKRVYETEGLRQIGVHWSPSTNWAQGGLIIDQEKLCLTSDVGAERQWMVDKPRTDLVSFGPTALIAAMRGYVASKLGNEVEVPDELMN